MKVMISQPMRDKTDEQIREERATLVAQLEKEGYEVVDSIFQDEPPADVKNKGAWYLAKSIELMSKVDAVVFMKEWVTTRECRVEHYIADEYEIFMRS